MDIQDLNQLMNETDDHQDQSTENAIEAIVSFNSDMNKIAMNAYQMKDMISYVLQENELLINWLEKAEQDIINDED